MIGVAGPLAAGSMTRVMLRSGAEVRGEVLKEREEAVLLDLGYTVLTLPKAEILEMKAIVFSETCLTISVKSEWKVMFWKIL